MVLSDAKYAIWLSTLPNEISWGNDPAVANAANGKSSTPGRKPVSMSPSSAACGMVATVTCASYAEGCSRFPAPPIITDARTPAPPWRTASNIVPSRCVVAAVTMPFSYEMVGSTSTVPDAALRISTNGRCPAGTVTGSVIRNAERA